MRAHRDVQKEEVGPAAVAAAPAVQKTAEAGTAGAGGRLPFAETIQASFGHHDISHINAHTGSEARRANESMGSNAYATGSHVAFGGTPDLHTAAHEAAHVVQQKRGVSLSGGVGAAGDVYERHADQVADAVVAGRSAAPILDRHAGGGARSAVQHDKKKLKKGTELTKHKAGSKGAKEDFVELMSMGDDGRVAKLRDLFETKSTKGNQLFYHVLTLITGDNSKLPGLYLTTVGRSLKSDITTAIKNTHAANYLYNVVDLGEPRLEDKLRLALGLVTGSSSDSKEVIKLFEDADDKDKLRIWGTMKTELTDGLGNKIGRLEEQVKTLTLVETQKTRGTTNTPLGEHEMLDQKDQEVSALALTCVGKLAMKRDKLKEVLPQWSSQQTDEVRRWVTRTGSTFRETLAKQHKPVGIGFLRKYVLFTDSDIQYAVDMVINSKPVGDEFFQDGEDSTQMPQKQKDKREKKQKEEGGELGELVSYMDRKERDNSGSKVGQGTFGYRWGTLKEKIDEMDNLKKDAYLRTFLSSSEQAEWDDENTQMGRLRELREQAIQALGAKLKSMGMEGHKASPLRKKLLDGFRYGSTEITHHGMSTYQRIKSLVKSKVPRSQADLSKKMMTLMRKLRGDEYAFLRADTELMQKIQQAVSQKYWEQIQTLLGITLGGRDRGKGDVDVNVLGQGDFIGKKKYDLDTAQQHAVDEAELQPSHWAIVLGTTLKFSSQKKRTEVNSIVTRAYMAALRRERETEHGPLELSGNRTLKKMSAGRFMRGVRESLTPGAMKVLESGKDGKFKHAYNALMNGTRPTVDEQIEDTLYGNQLKRTSGNDADPGKVSTLFQDLSGRALLDEWSNIEDFRNLHQQWKIHKNGGNDNEAEVLARALQDFIIDIRDDRRAMIVKMFSQKDLVKIEGDLRNKLVSAMASDSEAIGYLREVGFDNDELARARTKNLMLLDQQKQRSTGAQHNTFLGTGKKTSLKNPLSGATLLGPSSISSQTKESTGVLLGRTRKAQGQLHEGKERGKVVDENSKDIEKAQKELTERGKAFDEMQKKYNKFVMLIVKALVIALVAAATAAVTVLTGGAALGPIGIAIVAGKALLKSTILKLVQAQLEGDSFNTTAAITDICINVFAAAAGGVVSEFGGNEILSSMGIDPLAEPMNETEAVMQTLATKGLKMGTKQIVKAALNEARSTETNPRARLMVMSHMGGTILHVGALLGASAYSEFNQSVQEDTSQHPIGQKSSDKFSKGLDKGAKKFGMVWKKIEGEIEPEPGEHGSDRDQDMSDMVPAAIMRGEQTLKDMKDAGEHRTNPERYRKIRTATRELKSGLQEWQDKQKTDKGLDGEMTQQQSSNQHLMLAAVELHAIIDEDA